MSVVGALRAVDEYVTIGVDEAHPIADLVEAPVPVDVDLAHLRILVGEHLLLVVGDQVSESETENERDAGYPTDHLRAAASTKHVHLLEVPVRQAI